LKVQNLLNPFHPENVMISPNPQGKTQFHEQFTEHLKRYIMIASPEQDVLVQFVKLTHAPDSIPSMLHLTGFFDGMAQSPPAPTVTVTASAGCSFPTIGNFRVTRVFRGEDSSRIRNLLRALRSFAVNFPLARTA
jgi:hypothetical protein